MTKLNCPKIKDEYFSYGVQIPLKNGDVCWVTFANGSTLGTEKGLAKLSDEADAHLWHFRLVSSNICASIVKVYVGCEKTCVNKKSYTINDYVKLFED